MSAEPAAPEDAAPVNDLIDDVRNALERAREQSVEAAAGTELAIVGDDAIKTKARLQAALSTTARGVRDVQLRATKARAEIEAQRAKLDAMVRQLEKELEPMVEMVQRMQDGIGAVNLYLGRDEYIETLIEGSPAAADEPLHIRQAVLAMDEESAILAEGGGMDFQDIGKFTDWLIADPARLDQLIPERKAVVAMIARRQARDYGDPWDNARKNAENHRTWWLLRNGESLYLMTTDFDLGMRVTPRRDEFTNMFLTRTVGGERRPMEPGTSEWLKAEKAADARTRHYMKVALILQGLVDRTAVFHPLPANGLNLLDQSTYDRGLATVIVDDEFSIGDGRQGFADWHAERLALLDVGMRVIGHFPQYFGRYETERVIPRTAEGDLTNVAHTITRGDASHLYFTFDRTDTVWRRGYWDTSGPAKTRATYMLDRQPWSGSAAYIPVDTVEIEDMEYYLGRRSDRHEYRTMFPALKAAIAFKRAEHEAEAPFRALLAQRLVDDKLATDLEAADAMTGELIRWWKTANKWHRALSGDPEHEAKAQRGILREAHRRAQATVSDSVLTAIRAAVPDALVIAARTNDIVAVVAQPRRYPEASVPHNYFVTVHEFTRTGKPRKTSEWKSLTRSQVAKWTVLESSAAWAGWSFNTWPHLTDNDIDALIETARQHDFGRGLRARTIMLREAPADDRCTVRVISETVMGEDWRRSTEPRNLQAPVTIARGVEGLTFTFGRPGENGWDYGSVPVPHHMVGYYGEPKPDTIIWEDPEVVAAEADIVGAWFDETRASKLRSEKTVRLENAIRNQWQDTYYAAAYERFLEDFADPELWDGHKKTIKVPRNPFASAGAERALTKVARHFVDNTLDPSGMTFAEMCARAGVDDSDIEPLALSIRVADDFTFPESAR